MFVKHTTDSHITEQKIFLLVLLAIILFALLVAVPMPWQNTNSQVAASWGNSLCEDTSAWRCPELKIAASWGNKVETVDSR